MADLFEAITVPKTELPFKGSQIFCSSPLYRRPATHSLLKVLAGLCWQGWRKTGIIWWRLLSGTLQKLCFIYEQQTAFKMMHMLWRVLSFLAVALRSFSLVFIKACKVTTQPCKRKDNFPPPSEITGLLIYRVYSHKYTLMQSTHTVSNLQDLFPLHRATFIFLCNVLATM